MKPGLWAKSAEVKANVPVRRSEAQAPEDWRVGKAAHRRASVLECGGPPPLSVASRSDRCMKRARRALVTGKLGAGGGPDGKRIHRRLT